MNASVPLLRIKGLAKLYGEFDAVRPLDLDLAGGEFCAILGPSGCGKSTLLRMIAGFVTPSSGEIHIAGTDVTALGPEQRPTNMVFQSYGLFPHLDVAQNVAFGLALQKRPQAEIETRVREALALVRLSDFANRNIAQLSGGQQQRVALARALIMRPKVLLLDEPLTALDLKLRHQMQEELRRIHQEIGGTFLFVTHDQGEAFALASKVVVMNAGRVEQVGTPEAIYLKPASVFVADFVGETTVLAGERKNGTVQLNAGLALPSPGKEGAVRLVIRPERIRLAESGIAAMVEDVVFLGASFRIAAKLPSGETLLVRDADPMARERYPRGSTRFFAWNDTDAQLIEVAR
jgi:ABC-type Fe3+/spermidine/putrescine transport system ATPase subunit